MSIHSIQRAKQRHELDLTHIDVCLLQENIQKKRFSYHVKGDRYLVEIAGFLYPVVYDGKCIRTFLPIDWCKRGTIRSVIFEKVEKKNNMQILFINDKIKFFKRK